jgi:hypothetical protein
VIQYASTAKVSVSAARKIQEEIGAIHRAWWRGAIGVDAEETDRPAVLSGATPVFHKTGVPDEDDLFMAFADASFILAHLDRWAKRFKIKWHIRMNDEDWGSIDATGLSRPLLDQMEKWARRVGAVEIEKGTWVTPGERLEEMLQKYKDRLTIT